MQRYASERDLFTFTHIKAQNYNTTLPASEVQKTVRDVEQSRSSGGIIVVADGEKVSQAAARVAAANNIQIVESNRNLPSNLEKALHTVKEKAQEAAGHTEYQGMGRPRETDYTNAGHIRRGNK